MKEKIIVCVLIAVMQAAGIQVQSLYTNHRALRAGDLLTVLIAEDAEAGTSSNTKTSTKNGVSASSNGGSGLLGFVPSFGVDGDAGISFDGQGDTKRRGEFNATISVRVEKVLDNGILMIRGSKEVKINDEEQLMYLSGLIHPSDIRTNNTILSYNIADAEITYSGEGTTTDAQRAGVITRFFNWFF
ncbi:MAG: flagellar basal body L-ring protein FlgH [Fibrobacterota bacterium]